MRAGEKVALITDAGMLAISTQVPDSSGLH
jgi:hypothetical protein